MKNLQQTLVQPIPNTPLRLWHALAFFGLFWISPIFLPDAILQQYIPVVIAIYVGGHFAINLLVKRIVRVSTVDVILIERFFILLTFVIPAIIATSYGIRHGFDVLIIITCGICWFISLLLVLGVVIHIKSAHKYYHGVKKENLFQ